MGSKIGTRLNNLVQFFKDIPKDMKRVRDEFDLAEAEHLLEIVKNHIKKQDLPWVPLKSEYKAYKKSVGLSGKIWVATGELQNKLSVQKGPTGYYIGAPKGKKHKGSGLELNYLIAIHEYGSVGRGIPARPLMLPSKLEASKGITKRFMKYSYGEFKDRIKKI